MRFPTAKFLLYGNFAIANIQYIKIFLVYFIINNSNHGHFRNGILPSIEISSHGFYCLISKVVDVIDGGQIRCWVPQCNLSSLLFANDKSANEDLTESPNKYNKKAKAIDLIKTPLFAKSVHNTDSIHTQEKGDDDAIT